MTPPSSQPQVSIDAMKQRLHDLEQELIASQEEARSCHAQYELLELAVRGSSDGLWNWNVVTSEAYFSLRWKSMLGYADHALPNTLDAFAQLLHPDDRDYAFGSVQAHFEGRMPVYAIEVRMQHKDGGYRWILARGDTIRDPHGKPLRMAGTHTDITARKEAETAREQAIRQEETIRVQQAALAELSTPLIPITDEIVVLPLIGTIDSGRAQQVMTTLLEGIARSGARTAIIDITGVVMVDTQVANVLLQAARVVKLLGAQVMLTGMRPEIAQTLIGLGVNLGDLITCASLQSGIARALRQT